MHHETDRPEPEVESHVGVSRHDAAAFEADESVPEGWVPPRGTATSGGRPWELGLAYDQTLEASGEMSCGPIRSRWELVGPQEATAMLVSRGRGRKLDRRRVGRLRSAMEGGRWELRIDPISLDESGTLVDGRHRLAAVVEAGVRLWFLVARNLPSGCRGPFADEAGEGRRRRS